MSEARSVTPYAPPEIRDHGRLSVLTTFDGGGLHFAQAPVGSLPGGGGVTPPATPGQGVLTNTQSGGGATPDVPGTSGVADTGSSGPGSGSAPSGAGTGTHGVESGVASGSESLPFTGMAVGPVAALGAGLTAAGAALRRRTRRP